MSFNINHDEAGGDYSLLPEGEYEVVVKYAHENATKSGTVYISLPLAVRNDIEQKYQNKILWHALWHRREPSAADLATDGYSNAQIQAISKAVGLPNGRAFGSLEEWMAYLEGKPLRVTVKHEAYNNQTRERVQWTNNTLHPDVQHVWRDPALKTAAIEAEEDDLPF